MVATRTVGTRASSGIPRVEQQVPQQLTSTPSSSRPVQHQLERRVRAARVLTGARRGDGVAHEKDLDVLVADGQRLGEAEGVVRPLAAVRRRVDDQQDRHGGLLRATGAPAPWDARSIAEGGGPAAFAAGPPPSGPGAAGLYSVASPGPSTLSRSEAGTSSR